MTEEFKDQQMPGARFHHVDLTAASFERVDLTGASFRSIDLQRATIRNADLRGVTMRGVYVDDAEISGEVLGLRINGIDVAPLVEAELDRRHPERATLHPTDAGSFRTAWTTIEKLWAETVERARGVDPALLHEQVDGEWSFIETLRHLAFATDCWVGRAILGRPSPWHPLSLPWDEMPDTEGVPRDRVARPSLDEALALRRDRMDMVRRYLDDLTDEVLASDTEPVDGPGWPEPRSYPVRECLGTVLNEEWWHRQFALRDLDALTSAPPDHPGGPTTPSTTTPTTPITPTTQEN